MLAFAIASFFALALIGSMTVIGLMFFGYHEKILDVLLEGLSEDMSPSIIAQPPVRIKAIKPRQVIVRNRGLQSAPLSAAA